MDDDNDDSIDYGTVNITHFEETKRGTDTLRNLKI